MKLGFTGTQIGLTLHQRNALRALLNSLHGVIEFHHGDCIGADATAHGMMVLHTRVEIHPADNKTKRAFCTGAAIIYRPKPPLVRNVDIVSACDTLVACPKESFEVVRSGTWATIREAYRQGKPVKLVLQDGRQFDYTAGFDASA